MKLMLKTQLYFNESIKVLQIPVDLVLEMFKKNKALKL